MRRQNITTFDEAVNYLYQIPRFTSKNTMEDTRAFLQQLGDPDRCMRIIHVAGTNGKGSTCSYMRSILEAAGKRVALFTSPHLVDVRERFLIEGKMPEKESFLAAFLHIYNRLDWNELEAGSGYHPTFFEYLFFMAMLMFRDAAPDYCILETGLGGRLDATNSVTDKVLTVITRISLDHVEYLGNTVEAVAGEKAGIIRAGVPVVYSDTDPVVTGVFEKTAREVGTKTYPVSKNCYTNLKINNKTIDFSLHYRYDDSIRVSIATIAPYQAENAALAVRVIEVLDPTGTITIEQIRQGLAECFWAGRMEEVLPGVFVDGAHNEDGIRAFLDCVAVDGCNRRKLLFSAVSDKDYVSMLEKLVRSGYFDEIIIAHMNGKRAASLGSLEEVMLKNPGCAYTLYDNVGTAFHDLVADLNGARLYVAGSLYLVGEIKELVNHDQF